MVHTRTYIINKLCIQSMSKVKITHYVKVKFIYKSHVSVWEFEIVICYVIMI